MVSKSTKAPYVKFIGNSAVDVTGSAYVVRFKKYCILLDFGLVQGYDIYTNYKMNYELIKKVKPKEIDFIILHELHQDHIGNIPALFAKGCNAHIYIPYGNQKFLRLLWEDSLKIMQQDCLKLNNSGKKASPFYTQDDIEKALQRIIEIPYSTIPTTTCPHYIEDDIVLTYYPSGHIIGACQIHLDLIQGSVYHRLNFTGDIAGPTLHPYVEKRLPLPYANVTIAENTYNQPKRQNKSYDRVKDFEKIEAAVKDFNKILFGTFSLNRCQVLLRILHGMWQYNRIDRDIKVYVDAPLAQKFCNLWPWGDDFNPYEWDNVHFVESWEESQMLQKSNEHCIIISTSNFLTGGRIIEWLKSILPDSNNELIFSRYAGENNLASEIKYGGKIVNVDGKPTANNANIIELNSFSSHASYEELMDYYSNEIRYDKIALVHGDMRYKPEFCNALQQKLIEQGKSSRVICVNQDQKVYF